MLVKSKKEDLENFIAVADCGSFSGAGNILNIQVAKISRSIARLESKLNATLFNRSTRRIELTEEGVLFLKYARSSLETLGQGEEMLNLLKNAPAGKLKVDAASAFLYQQIIPHVAAFQEIYPNIQLEFISNESIIDLIEKRTDIAIRIGQLADSNLHAKVLGKSKLHIVASPCYLAQHGLPQNIAQLKEHKIIGFSNAPQLNNWHLKTPFILRPTISASSGEAIRQLVLNGNGIALLSNFMIRQDLENNLLTEILPDSVMHPNPREDVHAVYYRNSAVSSRISAFINFFASRFSL